MDGHVFMVIENDKNSDLDKENGVKVGALEVEKVKKAICVAVHSLNGYFSVVSFVLHFLVHKHILVQLLVFEFVLELFRDLQIGCLQNLRKVDLDLPEQVFRYLLVFQVVFIHVIGHELQLFVSLTKLLWESLSDYTLFRKK